MTEVTLPDGVRNGTGDASRNPTGPPSRTAT